MLVSRDLNTTETTENGLNVTTDTFIIVVEIGSRNCGVCSWLIACLTLFCLNFRGFRWRGGVVKWW